VVDALVVGIGINVNQVDFHDSIRPRATSLSAIGGGNLDRCVVLANVLAQVETCVDSIFTEGFDALGDELARSDALVGKEITNGRLRGIASGISARGSLLLRTPDGIVELTSGEVDVSVPSR
jgi:BirA family biotin operon repressor/biotin-[acetyl-CoA-carboxylase] ligase